MSPGYADQHFPLSSVISGMIGWAVWTAMAQRDYGNWSYGWSFGLALGAWILNIVATLSLAIQSPARDLKAGERLASDTVHGRRGSFADIFTRGFWTGGAGQQSGRERARRGEAPTSSSLHAQ
jgi:hypothetical protein